MLDESLIKSDMAKVRNPETLRAFIDGYIKRLEKAMGAVQQEKVEKIAEILFEAYKNNRHVYVMGNGGSAATAAHMVCDLAKGTIWPIAPTEKRFRVIGLADNTPLMTAWTNDIEYSQVFREQLLNILESGDVVIGISASGNSPNVINAVEYANSCGAITIGLTGMGGGKLKGVAKECIIIDSDNMERVEDAHHILAHIIKSYLNVKLNLIGLV